MDFPVMPFSRQSRHPVTTTTMTTPHPRSPVTMILVFTCLLNSSHHPACSATTECSGEVEAYKIAKEKADEVRTKKSYEVVSVRPYAHWSLDLETEMFVNVIMNSDKVVAVLIPPMQLILFMTVSWLMH